MKQENDDLAMLRLVRSYIDEAKANWVVDGLAELAQVVTEYYGGSTLYLVVRVNRSDIIAGDDGAYPIGQLKVENMFVRASFFDYEFNTPMRERTAQYDLRHPDSLKELANAVHKGILAVSFDLRREENVIRASKMMALIKDIL